MIGPVAVVGAGRAGRGVARALRAAGVAVSAVIARREPQGTDPDGAAVGDVGVLARDASVLLLAVQDAALPALVASVAASDLARGTVVLQMSGSAPDAALRSVRERGHAAGTMHPLVPLAEPGRAAEMLRGAWIGVGGDAVAVEAARGLAAAVGARTLAIPPTDEGRAVYHAAAVIASNFPAALATLAESLFRDAGVDRAAARDAAWQLMRRAVDNLAGQDAAQALTGPIARGDLATVQRHLRALSDSPPALAVYRPLSRVIVSAVGERLPSKTSAALAALLDDGAPVDGE